MHSQCNEEYCIFATTMSSPPPDDSSDHNSQPTNNNNPDSLPSSPSIVKLRKIPPIPIRQTQDTSSDYSEECSDEEDDDSNNDEDPVIVQASALGLNHIRTRSDPSRLRFSSSLDRKNSNLGKDDQVPPEPPKDAAKLSIPLQHAITLEPGYFSYPLLSFLYKH